MSSTTADVAGSAIISAGGCAVNSSVVDDPPSSINKPAGTPPDLPPNPNETKVPDGCDDYDDLCATEKNLVAEKKLVTFLAPGERQKILTKISSDLWNSFLMIDIPRMKEWFKSDEAEDKTIFRDSFTGLTHIRDTIMHEKDTSPFRVMICSRCYNCEKSSLRQALVLIKRVSTSNLKNHLNNCSHKLHLLCCLDHAGGDVIGGDKETGQDDSKNNLPGSSPLAGDGDNSDDDAPPSYIKPAGTTPQNRTKDANETDSMASNLCVTEKKLVPLLTADARKKRLATLSSDLWDSFLMIDIPRMREWFESYEANGDIFRKSFDGLTHIREIMREEEISPFRIMICARCYNCETSSLRKALVLIKRGSTTNLRHHLNGCKKLHNLCCLAHAGGEFIGGGDKETDQVASTKHLPGSSHVAGDGDSSNDDESASSIKPAGKAPRNRRTKGPNETDSLASHLRATEKKLVPLLTGGERNKSLVKLSSDLWKSFLMIDVPRMKEWFQSDEANGDNTIFRKSFDGLAHIRDVMREEDRKSFDGTGITHIKDIMRAEDIVRFRIMICSRCYNCEKSSLRKALVLTKRVSTSNLKHHLTKCSEKLHKSCCYADGEDVGEEGQGVRNSNKPPAARGSQKRDPEENSDVRADGEDVGDKGQGVRNSNKPPAARDSRKRKRLSVGNPDRRFAKAPPRKSRGFQDGRDDDSSSEDESRKRRRRTRCDWMVPFLQNMMDNKDDFLEEQVDCLQRDVEVKHKSVQQQMDTIQNQLQKLQETAERNEAKLDKLLEVNSC
jgi:hypothetical protein